MQISAADLIDLRDLLEPRYIDHQEFEALEVDGADDGAMAITLARIHVEDADHRRTAASERPAWKWMHAHPAYRAFFESAISRRERKWGHRFLSGEDAFASLEQHYRKEVETERSHGVRHLSMRLAESRDPLDLIYARACASSLARALTGLGTESAFKALNVAKRNVRKAIDAIDSIEDYPPTLTSIDPSRNSRGGTQSILRMLARMEDRLDREVKMSGALRTMHGPVRVFLSSLILNLGKRNCGTPSVLARLAEMADPGTVISDDTVGRILKGGGRMSGRGRAK